MRGFWSHLCYFKSFIVLLGRMCSILVQIFLSNCVIKEKIFENESGMRIKTKFLSYHPSLGISNIKYGTAHGLNVFVHLWPYIFAWYWILFWDIKFCVNTYRELLVWNSFSGYILWFIVVVRKIFRKTHVQKNINT